MLLFAGCLSAQDNLSALLPMPNQVKQIESKKDFIISGKTTIQTNLPEDAFCIAELKDILRQRTGKTPTLSLPDPAVPSFASYWILQSKEMDITCYPYPRKQFP